MKDYVVRINNQSSINQKDYIKAIQKGYWYGQTKYCNEITNELLGKKSNKVNKVIKHKEKEWFKYKGNSYYIDGKNIVNSFKNGEEELAESISILTDKRIELFPRFNKPNNFSSTNSKIGRNM